MTQNIPTWLASQIALRDAETYAGTVVSRSLNEHLAHVAAQQAANGLAWDERTNSWKAVQR